MDRTQLQALKEKYFEHARYIINNWFSFCGVALCYTKHLAESKNEPGFNESKFREKWLGSIDSQRKLCSIYGFNDDEDDIKRTLTKLHYIVGISFSMDMYCKDVYGMSFDEVKSKIKPENTLITEEEKSMRNDAASDFLMLVDNTLNIDNMEYLDDFMKFVILIKIRRTMDEITINLNKDMDEFFELIKTDTKINYEYTEKHNKDHPIWIQQLIDFYRHFGDLFFEKLKATTC